MKIPVSCSRQTNNKIVVKVENELSRFTKTFKLYLYKTQEAIQVQKLESLVFFFLDKSLKRLIDYQNG